MRRFLAGIILGALLGACGGGDFVAAGDNDDAALDGASIDLGAADGSDPSMSSDGVAVSDASAAESDAPSESRGDDGVTDAPGDRVDEEAPLSDGGQLDATPDRASDAPSDALGETTVDATCAAPTAYYRDRDKDGFGTTAERVLACVAPSDDGEWSTRPGDCRDDLPNVKPFQAATPDPPKYSGVGYADPVRPQGISFDFDCDGSETADPTNMYGAAPPCGALSTNCGQIGYLTANPGRNGVGLNAYCGSTVLQICVSQGLNCNPTTAQTTPFRCR
jgi:hypothetical protein